MIFFHRTNREAARLIGLNGFRDAEGSYMTDALFSGVWVSDEPLDYDPGLSGENIEVLFRITLETTEADLAGYETSGEGKPWREWLVPAAILNAGRIEEVEEDTLFP